MKQKICLLIMLLLIAGCGNTQQTITGEVVKEEKVVFGGLFGLTGGAATWGNSEKRAVELAIDLANKEGGINGKQIELVFEDSQNSGKVSLTGFMKLVDFHDVKVILGATWADPTIALARPAEERQVVVISPSGVGLRDVGAKSDFLFCTFHSQNYEVKELNKYLVKKGYKRFVIIHNIQSFSSSMKDIFTTHAKTNDFDIVEVYAQNIDDLDYRTILAQVRELDIDAIYAPLGDTMPKGEIIKQMKEMNIDLPIFGIASDQNHELINTYGSTVDGLIYPFPDVAENFADFAEKFEAKYGHEPLSPSAPMAYDSTNMVIKVMREGAVTADEIRIGLNNIVEYPGASNTITFDDYGDVLGKTYDVKTIKNGEFVTIDNLEEEE